jgi:hypothetical protein
MVQNYITGCTVVFNRALAARALPIPPEALIHDHWLALVAAATGRIITLRCPTMLYRQHGNNQIGTAKVSTFQRVMTVSDLSSLEAKMLQLTALEKVLACSKPAGYRLVETTAYHMNRGGLAAIRHIWAHGIGPSNLAGHLYLSLQLLLRGAFH